MLGTVSIVVLLLVVLGIVAAQHFGSWLYTVLLYAMVSLALGVMRRDRLA